MGTESSSFSIGSPALCNDGLRMFEGLHNSEHAENCGLTRNTSTYTGVRALTSCPKLNHSSYAMPSASPFYTTTFPAMDTKPDISNDTSALFELWRDAPVLHPGLQRVSQPEAQTTCTVIGQSQALLGCGSNATTNSSNIESPQLCLENNQCAGDLQSSTGLISPRTDSYTELDYNNLASWSQKHPDKWSTGEVLDWLYCTADQHGLDGSKLRGESFQAVGGSELCRMSLEDFVKAEPEFGDLYYQVFQNLLKSGDLCDPTPSTVPTMPTFSELDMSACLSTSVSSQIDRRTNQAFTAKASCPSTHTALRPAHVSGACGYPYQPVSSDFSRLPFTCSKHEHMYAPQQPQTTGDMSECGLDPYTDYPLPGQNEAFMSSPYPSVQFPMPGHHTPPYMSVPPVLMHPLPPPPPPQRRPGRPRKSNSVGCVADVHGRRDRRGTGKNQHLWEFIYDTLTNPMYNPQYVRWENKQEGIFRIVQSEALAQLWGNLKNNDNMTYEKLSRAMRHYYKRGILERVEGRRLVYKFSRSAMDRMRQRHNSI